MLHCYSLLRSVTYVLVFLRLSRRYVCRVDITGPVYKKQVAYGMNMAAASPISFAPSYGVFTKSTNVNGNEATALCVVSVLIFAELSHLYSFTLFMFTLVSCDDECISPTP